MPVETFAYLDSLDATNPPASDGLVQGDDHIRGIKSVLKSTFPNISAAVTATAAQINQLVSGVIAFAAGSAGAPSAYFVDTTLGFYRSAAGIIGIAGTLDGDGAVPVGSIHCFLDPADIPATGYARLNGQAISRTGIGARLFAKWGTRYGVGDGSTTFNVRDLETSRYFLRAGSAGTPQADAIKTHTIGSVAVSGANHAHTAGSFAGPTIHIPQPQFMNESYATHGFTGDTWGGPDIAGNNALPISGTSDLSGTLSMTGTGTYTGDVETRPINLGVTYAVKL